MTGTLDADARIPYGPPISLPALAPVTATVTITGGDGLDFYRGHILGRFFPDNFPVVELRGQPNIDIDDWMTLRNWVLNPTANPLDNPHMVLGRMFPDNFPIVELRGTPNTDIDDWMTLRNWVLGDRNFPTWGGYGSIDGPDLPPQWVVTP